MYCFEGFKVLEASPFCVHVVALRDEKKLQSVFHEVKIQPFG